MKNEDKVPGMNQEIKDYFEAAKKFMEGALPQELVSQAPHYTREDRTLLFAAYFHREMRRREQQPSPDTHSVIFGTCRDCGRGWIWNMELHREYCPAIPRGEEENNG